MRIRLVSYNIHKGLSPLGIKKTLHQIKKLLEEQELDLIFLQEIGSRFVPPSVNQRFSHQLEYLADQKWPHFSYGRNSVYQSGDHGNAILSRWPIIESTNVDLTLSAFEKRGLLHARIDLGQEKDLNLFCTHLNLLEKHRQIQFGKILEHIKSKDFPYILCGDFNDWRTNLFNPKNQISIKEIHFELYGFFAKTFPSLYPMLPLDRIYYSGLKGISVN